MAKRNRKKKTAEELAAELLARRARDFDAVGMQPDAAALSAHSNVEITRKAQDREGKKVDHNVARRMDAFDVLKDGMAPGAFDAARRLERDMLLRRGEGDKGARKERVDEESPRDITDRMVLAASEVEAIGRMLSPRDFWLLSELIEPPIDRGTWRDHVRYVTGEANWNCQGAAVRAACVNLRDAYERLDVVAKKAA